MRASLGVASEPKSGTVPDIPLVVSSDFPELIGPLEVDVLGGDKMQAMIEFHQTKRAVVHDKLTGQDFT